MRKTINGESCWVCGTTYGLEYHHTFFGKKDQKDFTDKHMLGFYLCSEHHRGNYSPHHNRELDLKLKVIAQEKYEETHSRESFMDNKTGIGRNYL